MYALGVMLAKGEGGDANREEAITWFTSAAERNHSDAMVYLASLLSEGESGQDWEQHRRRPLLSFLLR